MIRPCDELINSDLISAKDEGKSSSSSGSNGVVEVVHVRSYAECAGVLAAHRGGIRLDSLTSRVPTIPITRL